MKRSELVKLIKETIKEVNISKQLINEQYYSTTNPDSSVTFSTNDEGEYLQLTLTGTPNYSLMWGNASEWGGDGVQMGGWNFYSGWNGWFDVPSGTPTFNKWCNSGPPGGPDDVEECVSQWMWFGPPSWNQDVPMNQCYQPGYQLCQSAVDEGTPIRLFNSEECCCVAAQAAEGFLSSDCMILLYGDNDPSIVWGCTDSAATNYNSEADQDDGSCEYPDLFGLDCDQLMNQPYYDACQQKCESNGYPYNTDWISLEIPDPTCLPYCHCYQEVELFACIDCEVQSIGMVPVTDLTVSYLPWCQGEGIDPYVQWAVGEGCIMYYDMYYQAPSSNGCGEGNYSMSSGWAVSNFGNGNNPFLSTYTGNSGEPQYGGCNFPDPESTAIPPTEPPNQQQALDAPKPLDPQIQRMQKLAKINTINTDKRDPEDKV